MTTATPDPIPEAGPGPLRLGPNEVMEHDQIVAYIAFRTAEEVTYVDQSREMGMSDGWVSDIANAVIKRALYPTRKKVTAKLREKYGDAGIPQADPNPTIVRAVGPREAVDRGFGPRSGDPTRTLADLQEAPPRVTAQPEEDLESEEGADDWDEMDRTELLETKSQEELAAMVVEERKKVEALQAALQASHQQCTATTTRLAQAANQITAMDQTAERMREEVNERDRTIAGQAEDLRQLEMAMDIQAQAIEDLQGFKNGIMGQLRQFAVLLYQAEMPPSAIPGYVMEVPATQVPPPSDCPPGCKDHRHGYPWD